MSQTVEDIYGMRMQDIKIPEGYGVIAFRDPNVGETFKSRHPEYGAVDCRNEWSQRNDPRLILMKFPKTESAPISFPDGIRQTYGTAVPPIPAGYDQVDFRRPKPGEYFLPIYSVSSKTPTANQAGTSFFGDRIILKKIPTIYDVYRDVEVFMIPDGYENLGFRRLKAGEPWLSSIDGKTVIQNTLTEKDAANPQYRIVLKKKDSLEDRVAAVYGPGLVLPFPGYTGHGFATPRPGELYLGADRQSVIRCRISKNFGGTVRLILEKLPEKKIIRVVRVLEYVGPEDWINNTFAKNGVGPKGIKGPSVMHMPVLAPDRTIRELSTFKEEVK